MTLRSLYKIHRRSRRFILGHRVSEILRWKSLNDIAIDTFSKDVKDGSTILGSITENCQQITNFYAGQNIKFSGSSFANFLQEHGASLKDLTVNTKFSNHEGYRWLKNCSSLRKLHIWSAFSDFPIDLMPIKKSTSLEEVIINDASVFSAEIFFNLFVMADFSHLQFLKLINCQRIEDSGVKQITTRLNLDIIIVRT